MPEAQDIEIVVPNVPTRENEDASMLAMEDGRRKDEVISDLRKQLERLGHTQAGEMATRFAKSPSARKRQINARKLQEQLQKLTVSRDGHMQGPCAPATVINFNPVPLTLHGELQRWMVPPAGQGLEIDVKFRGRTFRGSYMTIKTPHLYSVHSGATTDRQRGVDMPTVDYAYIPPLGLVHQFYDHFVEGASDAQNMGGVLVFEGDIQTLNKKNMERSDGNLWVPKRDVTLQGYGDVVYVAEPRKFEEFLEFLLRMQRGYLDRRIAEAHEFHNANADELRNQLSSYHRIWHNYGLQMGYITKPYPWAAERLEDHPSTEAVVCPDCHTRQKSPDQYFCPECNAPFDALQAFLAGKVVSIDRLSVYEGADLEAIGAEMRRRNANVARLKELGMQIPEDVVAAAELKGEGADGTTKPPAGRKKKAAEGNE